MRTTGGYSLSEAELNAILHVITVMKRDEPLCIYSDSQVAINISTALIRHKHSSITALTRRDSGILRGNEAADKLATLLEMPAVLNWMTRQT